MSTAPRVLMLGLTWPPETFLMRLIDGLAVRDYPQMAGGALLVAALALTVDGLLALVTRYAVSPGLIRGSATLDLVAHDELAAGIHAVVNLSLIHI